MFKNEVNLIHSFCFFMKHSAPFVSDICFRQRRLVILDYSIYKTQFTVNINYDKEEFGHLIDQYVQETVRAIRTYQNLRDCGWWNDTVFVSEQEVSEYFGYVFNSKLLIKVNNGIINQLYFWRIWRIVID